MEFNITEFLKKAVASNASDVHLQAGERPAVRIDSNIVKVDMPALSEQDISNVYETLLPPHLKPHLKEFFDLDFAYEIPGVSRFRVNLSRQLGKGALAIRTIPYDIKKINELCLPESIEQFASLNNGLVLITGPTGSGKSTTIASLIDYINEYYPKHIITVEDPVEFIFTNKKSIISQRQLLIDTPSFQDGIKYALRQDPDVIFVGEIRDRITVESALKAAETGHLVFATIHTNDAVQTVNRIVNMFDPSDRDFIRLQVAAILRGTISQKLIPLKSGSGRRPACEVLVATPTVKDFIEKDELESIYDLVKKGSFNNMITMNSSLFRLYEQDLISEEAAISYSDNKTELQQMMRGVYHGTFGGK
ncbi:MAG: PilT/PilU family type 4a pilus ATPase [Heliobacteriaceae bacterium]|nr:PilT/PilU family type 4a pilus ATPase [Heliobacteriaceae bacterium]